MNPLEATQLSYYGLMAGRRRLRKRPIPEESPTGAILELSKVLTEKAEDLRRIAYRSKLSGIYDVQHVHVEQKGL